MKIPLNEIKAAIILDCFDFLYSYDSSVELTFETITNILNCKNLNQLLDLKEAYVKDDKTIEEIMKKNLIVSSDIDEGDIINDNSGSELSK